MKEENPDRNARLCALLAGSEAEIAAALAILKNEDAESILAGLVGSYPNLTRDDCAEIIDQAFVLLWLGAMEGEFRNVGPAFSVLGWLKTTARNDALDLLRKQKTHRAKKDLVIQLYGTTPKTPLEIAIARDFQAELIRLEAALQSCTQSMGEKQKSVAIAMLSTFLSSDNGRWPSNAKIAELLQGSEPGVTAATVQERRKEVLKKFEPILSRYGRQLTE